MSGIGEIDNRQYNLSDLYRHPSAIDKHTKIIEAIGGSENDGRILSLYLKQICEQSSKASIFPVRFFELHYVVYRALLANKTVPYDEVKSFIAYHTNVYASNSFKAAMRELGICLALAVDHAHYPLLKAICDYVSFNRLSFKDLLMNLPLLCSHEEIGCKNMNRIVSQLASSDLGDLLLFKEEWKQDRFKALEDLLRIQFPLDPTLLERVSREQEDVEAEEFLLQRGANQGMPAENPEIDEVAPPFELDEIKQMVSNTQAEGKALTIFCRYVWNEKQTKPVLNPQFPEKVKAVGSVIALNDKIEVDAMMDSLKIIFSTYDPLGYEHALLRLAECFKTAVYKNNRSLLLALCQFISANHLSYKMISQYLDKNIFTMIQRVCSKRETWQEFGRVFEALFNIGVPLNTFRNEKKQTLLHCACQTSDHRLLRLLLFAYAFDIDAQDVHGDTPLHIACSLENSGLANTLLKFGANSIIHNDMGKLPYDIADESLKNHPKLLKPQQLDPVLFIISTSVLPFFLQCERLKAVGPEHIQAYVKQNLSSFDPLFDELLKMDTDSCGVDKFNRMSILLPGKIQLAERTIDQISKTIQMHCEKDAIEWRCRAMEKLDHIKNVFDTMKREQIERSEKEFSKGKHPEEFLCSITNKLMENPVRDRYGHYYEETFLKDWVEKYGNLPMVCGSLTLADFVPDPDLKKRIEDYKAQN